MTTRGRQEPGQSVQVHHVVAEAGSIGKYLGTLLTPIARVTPSHVKPEAFIALTLAAVNRNQYLMGASLVNPGSLVHAMRLCAVLGHLPVRGIFDFVPFRNKKAPGGWEVVGIEEYRGVIERMYRSGAVRSVHAEVVRVGDAFSIERPGTLPFHKYNPHHGPEERGPLAGVYAWAVLDHGNLSHVPWLNRHEVKKHRDASRSGDQFWGPWDGPEASWAHKMWRKTGLHELEPFVPTSPEYLRERTRALAAAESDEFRAVVGDQPVRSPAGDDVDEGVVDAEVVPESSGPEPVDWPDTPKIPEQ